MNIDDKLALGSFLLICLATVLVIIIMNHFLGSPIIPEETEATINFVKTVNVNKKDLFITMENLQNYPKILPHNYISVKIINQTGNTTYAKEEVVENGIKTNLVVRHTIIPYSNHTIEVMEGDARGTRISEVFDDMNSSTRVIIISTLHFHGILVPFGFLAQSNLEHAMDTALNAFVDFTNNQTKIS